MLKSVSNQAEAGPTTTGTASVANSDGPSETFEKRGELESCEAFPQSDNRALTELAVAVAERRVPEINACVDLQRQVIKQLAGAGRDTTSAQIMLDSLIVSLFLAAEERHRLRALVDAKEDASQDFRVFWKAG